MTDGLVLFRKRELVAALAAVVLGFSYEGSISVAAGTNATGLGAVGTIVLGESKAYRGTIFMLR